jgi:hypothetical protein
MHPVLATVQQRFQQALEPMSVPEMQVYPLDNDKRWNTQQIAEHLILTYQLTSKTLGERLAKKRRTNAKRTALQRWLQIMVVGIGHLPKGAPAPEATVPLSSPPASGSELARRMSEEVEKMDQLIDQCRQVFGMEYVASHVLLGPLRVDQWRRFHAVHGEHHLKQVLALKEMMSPTRELPVKTVKQPAREIVTSFN